MAEFYANATPRHGSPEGWVDAIKKRFPVGDDGRQGLSPPSSRVVQTIASPRLPGERLQISNEIEHHRARASHLAALRGNAPVRNKCGRTVCPVIGDAHDPL